MKKRQPESLDIRDWTLLEPGDHVQLRRHGVVEAQGQIDEIAPDGTLMWIQQDNALGRRLFHAGDTLRVYRDEANEQASHSSGATR